MFWGSFWIRTGTLFSGVFLKLGLKDDDFPEIGPFSLATGRDGEVFELEPALYTYICYHQSCIVIRVNFLVYITFLPK